VNQAEVGVTQAQARLDQARSQAAQAQAELDLMDVQIKKLTVFAPVDGVVVTRAVEPGEIVQPGGAVLTLGQLDRMTITVYLPEDRYGAIKLGMSASVKVDSFPGQVFEATVKHIADQAEFTPRNVQTEDGRRTTVFAIELSVSNPNGLLKPGMPADITFEQ
jgi:RND family efflux transporter MFP subunit